MCNIPLVRRAQAHLIPGEMINEADIIFRYAKCRLVYLEIATVAEDRTGNWISILNGTERMNEKTYLREVKRLSS
jgi:hypothetical protein